MRLVFVVPHLKISGGVFVLLTYASNLKARGHEVTIVVENKSPLRRTIANLISHRPAWFVASLPKILRVPAITEQFFPNADVLIVSAWQSAQQIITFGPEKGEKWYLIQHDERLYHGNADDVARTYQYPYKKIVVAGWLRDLLKKEFGQNAFVLPNTIDHTQFFPNREQLDNPSVIRILLLHHDAVWKGTKEGVVLVHKLQKKYPELRLILFGVRTPTIEYVCDEYQYRPQRLRDLYASVDIFLCPSWDEGFGLPSLEAMACGAALVTLDTGGSREYAFHEQTALVAPRKDLIALEQQIERLIRDSALRQRIATAGVAFVKQLPTWQDQAVRMERLLCHL